MRLSESKVVGQVAESCVWATVLFILFSGGNELYGQVKQLEDISVSLFSSVSGKNYQPLWLSANRGGLFEEFSPVNGVARIRGISLLDPEKKFDYAYGMELTARGAESSSTVYLNELYLSGKVYFVQLDAGRKRRTAGDHAGELSSGSLALGGNATPIPMVNVSVPGFIPVPLTHEFIQFKGNLAHGWLENTRYVKDTYLHEKSFYLQGGFDRWPVQGYAGMVHFVEWGGNSPERGELPRSFNDFISVFFGKGGGSNAPGGEQINALGNHLGIWDFGIKAESQSYEYHIYWQHFFEDGSGLALRNIGDGLYGINVQMKQNGLLSGLLWEFIYTKGQSGPGLADRPGDLDFCEEENCGYKYGGRDNYYNNFIYRSGWTYNGRSLGTPLFVNLAQMQRYLPEAQIYNPAIESNRILAHHIGLRGAVNDYFNYRAFVTYVRHYGNYRGINFGQRFGSKDPANDLNDYEFFPPLHQWSLMLEATYGIERLSGIEFTTTLAWDTGDLTNNAGILFGATWDF